MPKHSRVLRPVVHVTVEGEAERLYVAQLRAKLTANRVGPQIKILNARGKGALNVVQTSLRCAPKKDYAARAVILDTDTDWNDRSKKLATQGKLIVIEMDPCLEASLLCAKGIKPPSTTRECKALFLKQFGGEAHDPKVAEKHFGADVLHQSAMQCELGTRLLSLFE